MTYALSAALQKSVFQHLSADAALALLVGANIFDSAPTGEVPGLYVTLGQEVVADRSSQTSAGARHDLTISIVSTDAGFLSAKDVAAAICDSLLAASLTLDRGRVVALNFRQARARRVESGSVRRIDLRFRALLDDA